MYIAQNQNGVWKVLLTGEHGFIVCLAINQDVAEKIAYWLNEIRFRR